MVEKAFGSKLDELKYLRVIIQSCQFEKTSNYFVMCTLQELSGKFEQKTFRTDVQKNTTSPEFTTNDFYFKVPWGARAPNRTFNDSLNSSKQRNEEPLSPSVYFQVFEVVPGEMEKWTAQQISTEAYFFENDLSTLLSGETVIANLNIKSSKSQHSSSQG
jgi:hypothetical protein